MILGKSLDNDNLSFEYYKILTPRSKKKFKK